MVDVKKEYDDLLFDVRRSIRYHMRRVRFFDRFKIVKDALSVIFGSATIFAVLSSIEKSLIVAAASVVTILSAIDLVVGSTKMSILHERLARRSSELEKNMVKASNPTEENVRNFKVERLDIEAEEPPVLRVLDALCYNELARAMGYDVRAEVRYYQRWFAQFLDIHEHKIKLVRQPDLEQQPR